MIAMKSTQLNDRQSLKIIQRLRTVVPFSSDREEPPKKTIGKAGLKTPKQYLFSTGKSTEQIQTVRDTHIIFNANSLHTTSQRPNFINNLYTVENPIKLWKCTVSEQI
jgi:hypothetical protein